MNNKLEELLKRFLQTDAQRRTGSGDQAKLALEDRENEGALMSALGVPTSVIGAVGAGYEGVKALGQKFPSVGRMFPGPFKVDETTSPASIANVGALLKGAAGQRLSTMTGGLGRSYEQGTPNVQQLLKELTFQAIEAGDFDLLEEAERGKLGAKIRKAEKERHIQEHPSHMDPRSVRSPMQGTVLAGQTALQTVPTALDPIGAGAETLAKKAGMSDEAALIVGILGGAVGTAGVGSVLKQGVKKGTKKLASRAAAKTIHGFPSIKNLDQLETKLMAIPSRITATPRTTVKEIAEALEVRPYVTQGVESAQELARLAPETLMGQQLAKGVKSKDVTAVTEAGTVPGRALYSPSNHSITIGSTTAKPMDAPIRKTIKHEMAHPQIEALEQAAPATAVYNNAQFHARAVVARKKDADRLIERASDLLSRPNGVKLFRDQLQIAAHRHGADETLADLYIKLEKMDPTAARKAVANWHYEADKAYTSLIKRIHRLKTMEARALTEQATSPEAQTLAKLFDVREARGYRMAGSPETQGIEETVGITEHSSNEGITDLVALLQDDPMSLRWGGPEASELADEYYGVPENLDARVRELLDERLRKHVK